jgi:hypothetical protein
MPDPIFLLPAEHVVRVKGNQFETLCFYLLQVEVSRRHFGHVNGNPPPYVRDGGVDLEVFVTAEPRVSEDDYPGALTPDFVGEIAVACKSGDGWRDSLKADAKKPEFLKRIKAGGFGLMFVHTQVGPADKDKLVSDVSQVLAEETGEQATDISRRLRLVDANNIAVSYAFHPVRVDEGLRQTLAIPQYPGLITTDQWATMLRHQRSEPAFVANSQRESTIEAIQEAVTRSPAAQEPKVIWVSGPPGVGKSRVVLEALREEEIARRVLIADDFTYGREAVFAGDPARLGDGILVVDECSRSDVSGMAATFVGRAAGQCSTLILIGPADAVRPGEFNGLQLGITPLDETSDRTLIAQELGLQPTDEMVSRITRLTEGFPWFGVLLADAVRDDPGALPPTAKQWDATLLAISGPRHDYGGNEFEQKRVGMLRAKSLLAVMMTEGDTWDDLTSEKENRLGLAFDEKWSDLTAVARQCQERGLIRERQNWRFKYVTPRNLGRLSAIYFLTPPEPLGKRIRNHVPEYREYFYQRLKEAEVPEHLLRALSEDDLQVFISNPSWTALKTVPVALIARYVPGRIARVLRSFLEDREISELTAHRDERRDLVFALNHVCRRKEGFYDAEAALFRLALAENESYGNNATGVWKELFLGALSLTHVSFTKRLDVLEAHFRTGDEAGMGLAVQALGVAIGHEYSGPMYTEDDKVDGEWDFGTWPQVIAGKLRAWQLLMRLVQEQVAPVVVNDLCEVAAQSLRSAFYYHIAAEVLELVCEHAKAWPPVGKAKLRESISDVRDFEDLSDRKVKKAVDKLSKLIAPHDYHSRLVDVVGNWHPAGHIKDAEQYEGLQKRESQLDEQMALEGLQGDPPPLLDEIQWLSSPAAVRATPFMVHVGQLDKQLLLLSCLIEFMTVGDASNAFAGYLAGVQSAQGSGAVDPILSDLRRDPNYHWAFMLSVWRAGPTDVRVSWITQMLEEETLDPNLLRALEYCQWSDVSPHVLADFSLRLSSQENAVARNVALHIVVEAGSKLEELRSSILGEVILNASSGAINGTMEAHYWQLAANRLVAKGQMDVAIEAAIRFISSSEMYRGDEAAWKLLIAAMPEHGSTIWRHLSPILDNRNDRAFKVVLEMRSHGFLAHIPVQEVMMWVGLDEDRAVWAALMCNVQSETLDEIVRQLIIRFGAHSAPADELAARAGSTDRVVSSLAGHSKKQLENAGCWAMDANPIVAEWGRRLVDEMRSSYDYHEAWEEFRDRQYGRDDKN